jgi:membrane protein
MIKNGWAVLKETVLSFIEDEALTRGAAMAFYTVTSLAPILLIVIAIAGLFFGRDAAQNALSGQLQSLMGQQSAEMLQSIIQNASQISSSILATIVATGCGFFRRSDSAESRKNPQPVV